LQEESGRAVRKREGVVKETHKQTGRPIKDVTGGTRGWRRQFNRGKLCAKRGGKRVNMEGAGGQRVTKKTWTGKCAATSLLSQLGNTTRGGKLKWRGKRASGLKPQGRWRGAGLENSKGNAKQWRLSPSERQPAHSIIGGNHLEIFGAVFFELKNEKRRSG